MALYLIYIEEIDRGPPHDDTRDPEAGARFSKVWNI